MTERFWSKVAKTGDSCWNWTAAKTRQGYGKFAVPPRGSWMLAHRWAYENEVGAIPEGMCVCHECDNPGCVNPSHLFLGTNLDNVRDKVRKGRLVPPPVRRGPRVSHCPRGHEYSNENTYVPRNHGRQCRECGRIRGRANYVSSRRRVVGA